MEQILSVMGEGSEAGKEKLVGEPKFHPLDKFTMKLTKIHWMPVLSLACVLNYINV